MLNDATVGNARLGEEFTGMRAEGPLAIGREPCRDEREAGIVGRVKAICAGRNAAAVGALTGTHAETARRYLSGKSTPHPVFLAALCDALGVSEAWLLCGRGETYRDGGPHRVHVTPREAAVAVRSALRELQTRMTALERMLEYPRLDQECSGVSNGVVGGERGYRPATTPDGNGTDSTRPGASLRLRQRV